MPLEPEERATLDQIVAATRRLESRVEQLETGIRTGTYLGEAIKDDVNDLSTSIHGTGEKVRNLNDGEPLGGVLKSLGTLNTRMSEIDKAVDHLKSGEHLTEIVNTLDNLEGKISDLDKPVGMVRDTLPESIQGQLASLDESRKVHSSVLGTIGTGILSLIGMPVWAIARQSGIAA